MHFISQVKAIYVNMEEFELLTKALCPLPEKFHGLTGLLDALPSALR
ncbi:hypothetical protein OH492_23535 [Vibrio chagasii]|nr:hypothetical protein [Vibrio chagasii]